MKKNKNILIVTVLLALAAAFLLYQNKSGTLREDLHDFAVSDTGAVTKVFLADRNNHSVTLERTASGWKVNGKYNVRPDAMQLFLTTAKNLAVKTRVAKAAYNNVIKDIAADAIKCEIYQHGEARPMKVYYVGGSTGDVLGTFMLVENSSLPFVIELPGFQGYLTPRYSPLEQNWRDIAIFDYTPDEVKNIAIKYYRQPGQSFSIERIGNQFRVFDSATNLSIQHVDTIGLNNYLSFFKYLCFETWDTEFTDKQRDSLKTTEPINTISVTDSKGITKSITTFTKPITLRSLAQTDSLGNPLKYDIDRLYAFMNNGKELVVIQYYVFGKVFRQLNDFDLDKKRNVLKKTGK